MILLGFTLMLAFGLSLYGVPLARRAALKYGIVDSPDGRLKHQREPVPYLGGLAMYLSFLISLAFTFEFRQDVLGIVLAGTLVMMLGLVDDFGVLSPGTKLAGQLLAVFVLIKSGIRIEIAALPDWLDLALTMVWMVGIINAFNLLDIMDGLSAGVGVISATFLCAIALLNGDQTIAFLLAALIGSLLGFLRYNWHPATIYMGDAGAMFIGLMLGALCMIGQYTGGHSVSLLTPVMILGVPIFDTLFVMYIRFLRGLPIFLGSPDHMAIRLRHWGLSVPQVVLISYVAAAVLGGIGLLVMSVPQDLALVFSVLTLMSLGIAAHALTRVNVGSGQGLALPGSVPAGQPEEKDVRMILIVGAGLAGLSTAYHLRDLPYRVL
ncbi:MAG: undecaprenyl-phosphate alpha-N-acetylglucosaminyl 1-phosphate transferase [Nitrospiraceae bacterium]|nr:MAG: undecaprenyl-phosphate alpha-N-acetylglucosaminyl 1-phosphate transferase [Nitrospiraceae bacterium]